jgi:hypothetical protein
MGWNKSKAAGGKFGDLRTSSELRIASLFVSTVLQITTIRFAEHHLEGFRASCRYPSSTAEIISFKKSLESLDADKTVRAIQRSSKRLWRVVAQVLSVLEEENKKNARHSGAANPLEHTLFVHSALTQVTLYALLGCGKKWKAMKLIFDILQRNRFLRKHFRSRASSESNPPTINAGSSEGMRPQPLYFGLNETGLSLLGRILCSFGEVQEKVTAAFVHDVLHGRISDFRSFCESSVALDGATAWQCILRNTTHVLPFRLDPLGASQVFQSVVAHPRTPSSLRGVVLKEILSQSKPIDNFLLFTIAIYLEQNPDNYLAEPLKTHLAQRELTAAINLYAQSRAHGKENLLDTVGVMK